MVDEGIGFTKPWLDLDVDLVKKYAQGKLEKAVVPLNDIYPVSVLNNVKGKDVLCLASGGGQQSAVFGILGARVAVLDISDGQLKGDKKAAKHYGYEVRTVQGDMGDLSAFGDNSFDVVYQAPSMGYVPDLKLVYSEVARVTRKGGLYRADAQNPVSQFIDEDSWDGKGYRISVPYSVKEKVRADDKEVYEYRHYLDETFNGLIESGFAIKQVVEAPSDLYQEGEPEPGGWLHSLLFVPGIFAILAKRK